MLYDYNLNSLLYNLKIKNTNSVITHNFWSIYINRQIGTIDNSINVYQNEIINW